MNAAAAKNLFPEDTPICEIQEVLYLRKFPRGEKKLEITDPPFL